MLDVLSSIWLDTGMDLRTYIADMARRERLADACNTSPNYLWQIATKWKGRRPSPQLAKEIERVTAQLGPERVPKETLRPDVWSGTRADGEG